MYKNIVIGNLNAGGDIHIGDKIYYVERDFQHSILFLRLEPGTADQNAYIAQLFVRLQHPDMDFPEEHQNIALTEAITLNVPAQLLRRLDAFQQTRRLTGDVFRVQGRTIAPWELYQEENGLADALFEAFFSGKIGETCARFLTLADKQKLSELLLVISTDDEQAMNLPWEMVVARLLNGAEWKSAHSASIHNFGLVRTKEKSLAAFDIRGKNEGAGPLKMLFVTALPEDMGERDKLLEIEDEQRKLIQAVGNLEATGSQPKIVIEFLDNAALPEIEAALAARRHDILHISGHGAYLERLEKGVLYLEDERGDERKTSGAELGAVLRRHKSLKLLILSACETAIALRDGVVEGISAASGIPAILAMRFAVTDAGAKQFTTTLYDTLAKGETLAHSVAQGREALWRAVAEQRKAVPDVYHIAEWFTPVLYLNQFVGAIVDVKKPYHLPADFYPRSRFEAGERSRFIGQGFIGRKRYLIRLRRAFEQGHHVCLHGLGGMGKTTLAEAFVRNYRNRALKVVKFTGLEINVATLFERIYEHFCTLPDVEEGLKKSMAFVKDNKDMNPVERLGKLLHNCLDPNGTIFLFDNFEDQQTNGEGDLQREIGSPELLECLRYLCTHAPDNCHALFTTRYKIVELDDLVIHFALDQLSYAEQYRLMNYATHPKRGNPFDKLGMQERESVIRRLDGHPRAFEFLESLLLKDRDFNWTKLEATLGETEAQVFENLLLEKVYAQLTEAEKAVFQVASVFISRSPLAALAAVSERTDEELIPVLRGLADWSVVFWEENEGEFEVHGVTRGWVETRNFLNSNTVQRLSKRIGNYFQNKNSIREDILAMTYYEIAESWEEFGSLTVDVSSYLNLIGLNKVSNNMLEQVLKKVPVPFQRAQALSLLGQTLTQQGELDRAIEYIKEGINIFRGIRERNGEAMALNNLGEAYRAIGDFDGALQIFQESQKIIHDIGEKRGLGAVTNNIGLIYLAKGMFEDAFDSFISCLEIFKDEKDRRMEGLTLNNISCIYLSVGNYQGAMHFLNESLLINQELSNKYGEGLSLANIGFLYQSLGEIGQAITYFNKSIEICRFINDKRTEGTVLNNLGQIFHEQADVATAEKYLKESLAIHEEIGAITEMAPAFFNLGKLYFENGNLEGAIENFYKSYSINVKISSPNVSHPLEYLNLIESQIGEKELSILLLEKGLYIQE
jgi:tetratricopeptide (TPR) repeat protein